MSSVIGQLTVSLDGYVAAPDQDLDNLKGRGGMRLHERAFAGDSGPAVDADLRSRHGEGVAAYVMGRNMFGPSRGEWDLGRPTSRSPAAPTRFVSTSRRASSTSSTCT